MGNIPEHFPPCAVRLLARPQWFTDPVIVSRARLAPANALARLLTSPRFSGTDRIFAITLGGTIYIKMEDIFNPHTPTGLALLAHEVRHIQQYEMEGLVGFFAKYLQSYRSQGGYGEKVNFEAEAYTFQRELESHLALECANNNGLAWCDEVNGVHTPNLSFAMATPDVFRFPV